MITAEDTVGLCSKIAKYKKHLESQIKHYGYLHGKIPTSPEYEHKLMAYKNELEAFKSLIGARV